MMETVQIQINGKPVAIPQGTTVAAALINHGIWSFRISVEGERRAPLCGMGICFECRVTIDQIPHQRACMIACKNGMQITTHE